MPLQIFNLFISIISAIFSSSTQSSNLLPPEFGKPTFIDDTLEAKIHPLVKCYFLVRSDESITSCYEVIKNLKLPEEILISISNQLSSAKQQFIEIICLSAHHGYFISFFLYFILFFFVFLFLSYRDANICDL